MLNKILNETIKPVPIVSKREVYRLNRQDAIEILQKYMKGERYLRHSLAVEAIMKGLAKKLEPGNEEYWGIVGLLHDLDEEHCNWQEHPEVHGKTAVDILKKEGIDDEISFDAICAHNPASGVKPQTILQKAVYAADPMSGLCNATALCYPDKKISSVKVKSILKRIPETRFAAGANRQAILSIENIGIDMEEFATISLDAMKEISEEIGL